MGGRQAVESDPAMLTARGEILAMRHRDKRARSSDGTDNVIVYTFLALFLVPLPLILLVKMIGDKSLFLTLYPATVIGIAIWGYLIPQREANSLWESLTWLDFEQRTWNHEIRYTDGSAPTSLTRLRFDDLALLCFDSLHGEDGDEVRIYHVCLCRRWDAEQLCCVYPPEQLNHLLSVTTKEESMAFAFATASKWDLPCWRHDWATPGSADRRSMTRLC